MFLGEKSSGNTDEVDKQLAVKMHKTLHITMVQDDKGEWVEHERREGEVIDLTEDEGASSA